MQMTETMFVFKTKILSVNQIKGNLSYGSLKDVSILYVNTWKTHK